MLNVANWTDKQLDELTDLLRTADHSNIAAFIVSNFLAGATAEYGRIMSDRPATVLTVIPDTTVPDTRMVDLRPGLFLHRSTHYSGVDKTKVGQVDTAQTCAILGGTANWGTGQPSSAHPGENRWSIICIKQAEQLHTSENRWFVDDTVEPNTYSEAATYIYNNKSYYDIQVIHGTPDWPGSEAVPDAPTGYWTIAEIHVLDGATAIAPSDIYDTTDTSQHLVPNWDASTRIYRMEYYQEFPGGGVTKMIFYQAAAPPNWTQDATLNDRALRIVSGAGGGVGGSVDFSNPPTVTGNHQLIIAEMPSHHHTLTELGGSPGNIDAGPYFFTYGSRDTTDTGGDQPHSHPLSINLKYMDVILCSKD